MYLPVLLTVSEVMMHMRDALPTDGVDLNVVVKAMLDKVFHNHMGPYGRFIGPLGAYKIQAQENHPMSDLEIDMHLHEAEVLLIDVLSAALPQLPMNMTNFLYRYPGGEDQTNIIVYVPMDRNKCHPAFVSKLVPAQAVHYTAC